MRPTLATFGTLNPLGSPASKYRLSARLRKLRITSGNVMLQPANVKCRFTFGYVPERSGSTVAPPFPASPEPAPIAAAILPATAAAAAFTGSLARCA